MTWFADCVVGNRQRKLTHDQVLLKADKRDCVDTLIDEVHSQNHAIAVRRYTDEYKNLSNRAEISSVVRAGMHKGSNALSARMVQKGEDTHSAKIGVLQSG